MDVVGWLNGGLRRIPSWVIYAISAAYIGWEFWQALNQNGRYLVEPINELEREYGETALKLIVVGLMITPLRRYVGLNLLGFRRAIGVSAFFLVLAHFLVWAALDVQTLSRMWEAIVKRPYVTVGFVSFVMLIPLAVTSNNLSVRRIGAAGWRKLHKLTYPAAVLGGIHYIWLAKGFQIEPLIYLGVIVALLLTRAKWRRSRVMA